MRNDRAWLICGALAAATGCSGSGTEQGKADSSSVGETRSPPAWVVLPDSFGPIPLGVPVEQAEIAMGDQIPVNFSVSDGCAQGRAPSMPTGTSLMIIRDSATAPARVDRVDVDSAGIKTREGAGVGDSEQQVLSLYEGRVRVEPHKYTGPVGHYLTVTSPSDSSFLIIFETDGAKVLTFRAGRKPAVQYVEGCA